MSQFTSADGKATLRDWFDVPRDVYPVGRLDYDSEGLLILTNDKEINHRLLNPSFAHEREYWAQVEGTIDEYAIQKLEKGVTITIDGKRYQTRPALAKIIPAPPVGERNPPIRFRREIPDSWISLILKEGKNRQVRKMTAASGFPTLRLIRNRIAFVKLDGMQSGEMIKMNSETILEGIIWTIKRRSHQCQMIKSTSN